MTNFEKIKAFLLKKGFGVEERKDKEGTVAVSSAVFSKGKNIITFEERKDANAFPFSLDVKIGGSRIYHYRGKDAESALPPAFAASVIEQIKKL